jgi:hypothetical protein
MRGRSSFYEGFEIESAGDSEYVRGHAANLMFAISRAKLRSDVFKSSLTCTIKGIILRGFLWLRGDRPTSKTEDLHYQTASQGKC